MDRKKIVKTKTLKQCPKPRKIVRFSGFRMMGTIYPNCFKIISEPGTIKPFRQSKKLKKYIIFYYLLP